MVATNILSSGVKINQFIRDIGVYEGSKTFFIAQIDKSTELANAEDKAKLKSTINRSIKAADIEKAVEPIYVDIVTWLNSTGDSTPPKIVIELGQLKSKLQAGIEADFDANTARELVFGLTSQVSDQIIIPLDKVSSSSDYPPAASIKQIKQAYTFFKTIFWILIAVVVGLVLLLVLMHARQGRRKLQKPAWGFFNAGFTIVTLSFLLPIFIPTPASSELNMNNLTPKLIRTIMIDARLWGLVWLSICALLLLASLALKKPDHRKRK